jgi:hypothetical protein
VFCYVTFDLFSNENKKNRLKTLSFLNVVEGDSPIFATGQGAHRESSIR